MVARHRAAGAGPRQELLAGLLYAAALALLVTIWPATTADGAATPALTLTPDRGSCAMRPVLRGTGFPPGAVASIVSERTSPPGGKVSSPQRVTVGAGGTFALTLLTINGDCSDTGRVTPDGTVYTFTAQAGGPGVPDGGDPVARAVFTIDRGAATVGRHFPETGFHVRGRFLEYWQANGLDLGEPGVSEREALALFGYPISDEFDQRLDDGQTYRVQYFERARLEYHPENRDPLYQTLLGQFGRRIVAAIPGAPTAPAAPQAGYTHFPETGHNGGLAQFGYPLTELFEQRLEDGRGYEVQYFERARFELHPANAAPYDVQLGQFGRVILGTTGGQHRPDPASDNVFATILGPAGAPPGWRVSPCEGDAAALSIAASGAPVGQIGLSMSHLETLPDLQEVLRAQGLPPGAIHGGAPAHAPKIAAAMRDFVDAYHRTFEQDRQATYGGTHSYTRLGTQAARVGAIPGVRYGFVVTGGAGQVRERWLSFAAFDGALLTVVVAHYDPSAESSFASDEELRRFEPHLAGLMAGLRLPLPVDATAVREVRTEGGMSGPVPLFRFYSVRSAPVAELPPGVALQVTGQSPNGRWWRVACPNGVPGECWVSADPQLTRPTTR